MPGNRRISSTDVTRSFKILTQALGDNLKERLSHRQYRSLTCIINIVQIIFSEKNTIFLRESCQIVQPLAPDQIPVEAKENNYGLSNPGSIQAYLQVVDLMADKLRYASISLININIFFFYHTWAWHHHGSGTPTSPRVILLYN